MFLQRVQVPDFRVLKNVDISFEKEFTPKIFPLGSQNGGGKSTLLQLIFILLHCVTHPDRIDFLKNLLDGFKINQDLGERILATIDIWDDNKTVRLDFFTCNESYLSILLNQDLSSVGVQDFKLYDIFPESLEKSEKSIIKKDLNLYLIEKMKVSNALKKKRIKPICTLSADRENSSKMEMLFCKINLPEADIFLEKLSQKIFFAAHISQVFLFLSPNTKKDLFKLKKISSDDYYGNLKKGQLKLPGFFTYDFLAVDNLINSFKEARDKDFTQAVETNGEYGDNYKKLLDELHKFLINKRVNIASDLSGLTFKLDKDNTELNPEDLSHGELKRLFVYMWIKHNKIEDAIVLMDELEISFHPDWQYQIVRDLEEWGATNQYILATHSYDICEAVTPAHVKVLQPELPQRTQ